jgi:protein-disulfide isomerase
VSEATDAASKAGVNSTPTVLVEGEMLVDPSVESLRAAVDAALAE